jgi:hypothetical protein
MIIASGFRALQVGIRAWLVLSGPELGDYFCLYVNGIGISSIIVLLFLYVGCGLCVVRDGWW